MKLQQVSANCLAVLNQDFRVCDANSGLLNLGGGVVIDTQSDLPRGRRMIEIRIERLGSMRCRFAEPAGKLPPSR